MSLIRGKTNAIPFNLRVGFDDPSNPDSIVESMVIVNGLDDPTIATNVLVRDDVAMVIYTVPTGAADGDDHNVRLIVREDGTDAPLTKEAGTVGIDVESRLDAQDDCLDDVKTLLTNLTDATTGIPVSPPGGPTSAKPDDGSCGASTTRYAEPTDLIARYDSRSVGQLCTDDDQELSRTAILDHINVKTALDAASGRVEAALRHGARYCIDDLNNLTCNSRAHLVDIVCCIAMQRLLRRRPGCYTDLLAQVSTESEEHLKMLSSGYDVFSIESHVAAGLIDDGGVGNQESVKLLNHRNNLSDNLVARLFPHRGCTGRRRRNFG